MTHRRPVEWDFPLYQDDDQPRLAELANAVTLAEQALSRAEAGAGDTERRMGDDTPPAVVENATAAVDAAKKAYNDFVDDIAERTFVVRLRVVGSRRFREMLLDHPPRMVDHTADDGTVSQVVHAEDRGWGVNTDTFPRALIAFSDGEISTIVSPKFDTDAEREAFVDDELSDGELLQMWVEAHERNRGGSVDPKALPRYATPTSDET